MANVSFSYSRRGFRVCGGGRLDRSPSGGKEVWMDTDGIADAEVFPAAIKRATEG